MFLYMRENGNWPSHAYFLRYGSFKIQIDLYFRAPKGSNLDKVSQAIFYIHVKSKENATPISSTLVQPRLTPSTEIESARIDDLSFNVQAIELVNTEVWMKHWTDWWLSFNVQAIELWMKH